MLDFNFLGPNLNYVVKVVIAVKVVCFLIISGVESGYDIYESIKFDKCVEEVVFEMKAKNLRSPDAKAIHYCEGGDLVSLDD